jgi:DNA helicase IV
MNLHQMNPFLAFLCKKHKDPILKNFLHPKDVQLDSHQRKATFSPYKRCLCIAGAGSGKTKVITLRIATLLKLGISPNNMKIITFTNKATTELKERLHTLTNLPKESLDESVTTIHKLAIRTLRKIEPRANFHITNPQNPNDPILKTWSEEISSWMKSNPTKTPYLLELFSNPPNNLKMENTYSKQFHLKDLKFPTTMGIRVRSRWERRIVNYLASQHINFKYEEPILWADFIFRPDFYLPHFDAYIELLGLWSHPDLGPNYRADFKRKKHQFLKAGRSNHLLEIYPDDMQEDKYKDLIDQFLNNIPKIPSSPTPLVPQEDLIKSLSLQMHQLDQSLINNLMSEKQFCSNLPTHLQPATQFFFSLRKSATTKIQNRGLIHDSYLFEFLSHSLPANYFKEISHIFIDEFQDLQPVQMTFLQHLMQNNFFVIGDPRQAIYGFLGGSPYFIKNLHRFYKGVKAYNLKYNYRSQGHIVDLGNKFSSLKKKIKAKLPPSTKITILKVTNEPMQTTEIYEWIKNQIGGEQLMILARFQTGAPQNDLFLKKYNNLASKSGDTFLTFHSSKGLEADNVAIVGLNEWESWDSTPSKNMDSHLNTYVQNVYEKRDHYHEERRLFYVALTRAKKKLFLVTQSDCPSNFLMELTNSPQIQVLLPF